MDILFSALKEVGSMAVVAYLVWWGTTKLSALIAEMSANTQANTAALLKVETAVETMRKESEGSKRDTRDARADARDAQADARDVKSMARDDKADQRDAKASQ